jgi:hypothetical protein
MKARDLSSSSKSSDQRRGTSWLLKRARPRLPPRDDIGGILLVAGDAVIEFVPLSVRLEMPNPLRGFPYRIQQVGLLCCGETVDLASQNPHMPITSARFCGACKRSAEKQRSLS